MSDRDVRKLAKIVADHSRQIKGLSGGPQAAYSSIEGGSMDAYDTDGRMRLRIGAQDDGTHAVKYVQGPPPPRPTAPVVSVDGPVVRVRWDGVLLGGHIPEDFARIDVHFALASEDLEDEAAVRGNLATSAGNETVLAATETGTYRVGLVAMSQSRARSEMSDTVEVEVTLVGMGDAIEAVADSANGKNKVTWSSNPPTPGDEGIAGDTWFVGEVGRPNDIVEATNLLSNPSFENGIGQVGVPAGNSSGATTVTDTTWHGQGSKSIKVIPGTATSSAFYPVSGGGVPSPLLTPGKTYTFSALIHLEAPQTGTIFHRARKLTIGTRDENYVANYDFATSDQAPNVPGTYRLSVTAAIPAGYQGAFLMMANGSNTVPVWFDDAVLEEGVGSGLYFDGDTPDGETENESHYRWTGEPHASTSEKYLPALDIGDEDKWNVTEQYQHTGDEWVRIELSHRVFSTVDLAKATVGYLNGQRIEAGSIDTEQLAFGAATGDVLSVDALNFKTAVGLDIRGSSFRAGDAVEMTEDFGIRQFGPDGALNVSLPSDGSPAEFRGDLSARTLTATGRMSIQGPGAIASGGVLELESGAVPPVAGPQITNTWDRLELPQVEDNEAPVGLAWAEGHWWRAVSVTGASSSNDIRARVEKLTPTGELVSSFPTAFGTGFNGLTLHEGLLYTLGAVVGGAVGNRWVVAYNLDGTESHRWEYTSYGTGTYQPGIGTHGPNIAIAQCWASGDLSWRIYRPSDGYQISRVDRDGRVASDIVGIHLGQFDLDAQKIIVGASRSTSSSVQLLAYSHSGTPEFESGYSWYAADYAAIRGFAWDGSRFWTLQPDGHLAAYQPLEAGRFVGDNDSDWWCAIAWAADGGQETPVGPATNFRYLRRSRLRRQNGDVPEGVEAAAVFYAKTETEPARADLHWGGSNSSPDLVNHADYISASWQAARTPSAENTFTTDAPGEIHSALGNFRVDGTGAGEWGPLEFRADGTMTDSSRRMASGQFSVNASADATVTTTVTFPAGRFTREPIMLVTPRTDAMSQTPLVGAWNVTAESAQIAFRRGNSVETLINWFAIQQED